MPKKKNGKEKLISSAADLLLKYSSASIGTREIAEGVGFQQPLIYGHFRTKRNLFSAAMKLLEDSNKEGYERVLSREKLCKRSLVFGE